jgi:hypothetical protein
MHYISPYPSGFLRKNQLSSNPKVLPLPIAESASIETSNFTIEHNPETNLESKGFSILGFLCGLALTAIIIYNVSKPQHQLNNNENHE